MRKDDKLGYIKIKTWIHQENPAKRMKMQTIEWEKLFATNIAQKLHTHMYTHTHKSFIYTCTYIYVYIPHISNTCVYPTNELKENSIGKWITFKVPFYKNIHLYL